MRQEQLLIKQSERLVTAQEFEEILIAIAKKEIDSTDPAHDLNHSLRTLANGKKIAEIENDKLDSTQKKANPFIIISATIFHDRATYPKDDPRSQNAPKESAERTKEILKNFSEILKKGEIEAVCESIANCSFNNYERPKTLEEAILRDADLLEQTGAIAFARTCASGGMMGRDLYDPKDPFCEWRPPDALKYTFDFFFERSYVIADRMNTETGRKIAKRRTKYLKKLLEEFKLELEESKTASLHSSPKEMLLLEQTGLIALARICESSGVAKRPLYDPDYLSAVRRFADPTQFAVDFLFEPNTYRVSKKLIGETKKFATRRTRFLRSSFLREFRFELQGL